MLKIFVLPCFYKGPNLFIRQPHKNLMNDLSQITINTKQQKESLQIQEFNTPVTFIWYGSEVPEDYMIKLSTLTYPVQFFKNPQISRTFKRLLKLIQKADYYRLEYIYQNGGMYSDFDNQIDYDCVKKVLSSYQKSDKVIFWWQPKRNAQNRNVVPNSFIYAQRGKMQSMRKILSQVDQNNRELKFAGMQYLAQFANKQLIQVKQLYTCIKHEYDFSWVKQSDASSNNNKQKKQLANKKKKKLQIMAELQKVKRQNVQTKREYEILLEKYHESDQKLIKEYKKRYVIEGKEQESKRKEVSGDKYLNKESLPKRDKVIAIANDNSIRNNSANSSSVNRNTTSSSNNNTKSVKSMKSYSEPVNSVDDKVDEDKQPQMVMQAHGYFGTPPPSFFQAQAISTPQYSGQSIKSIPPSPPFQQTSNQPQENKINVRQEMDDTTRLILITSVVGSVVFLVCLVMVLIIWVKWKKYCEFAKADFQLDNNKIGAHHHRIRTIQKGQMHKQAYMTGSKNEVKLQRGMNEQNQSFNSSNNNQ